MKPLGLNEIRETFLKFFESKQHLRMKSFSLVPQNDKSLLLINSGMAPLKPFFTGQETPPNKRVTTCQKCIRTGDIENVGKTVRHGTFFEMLGNFSFGDYFKEEIIPWSWEFMTEVLEIPAEKLYISVYLDDDEAFNIWHEKVGIAKDRIFRMGKEDNFWEVGVGPCGPCSEIYYDKGEKYGCGSPTCTVGCDCDRYMEFWNLVFTQFNKEEDGTYTPLAHPNIDTGMGLERMACVMQNVDSIFDIDTFIPVRDKVCEISGKKYNENVKTDVSIRVITDHVRSMTFMAADGIIPANDGRGYIIKRLLRRAARHGKLLSINKAFLAELATIVIENSCGAYPELLEKKDYILKLILNEESRFYETLDQGMEILKTYTDKLKLDGLTTLLGEYAFKLYDTYGFPLELTQEILEEDNLTLSIEEFHKEMQAQKERARFARGSSTFLGAAETIYNKIDSRLSTMFFGYSTTKLDNINIIALVASGAITDTASAGETVSILLDKTPFYAEGGGQAGDRGEILTDNCVVEITDCIKVSGDRFAHIGIVSSGVISVKDKVTAVVSDFNRRGTARNHSATHLLQKALRDVLGNHVEQAGSFVTNMKLRFDFTHFSPLTTAEIEQIEVSVNEKILSALRIEISEMSIEDARKLGAIALFGEKYGETVRVVNMGGHSIELCGGTHVANTAEIGGFKITSETSAAAGVRRIEAVTGFEIFVYYKKIENELQTIRQLTKATQENVVSQVKNLIQTTKDLQIEVNKHKEKAAGSLFTDIWETGENVGGVTVISSAINLDLATDELRVLSDKVKDKLKSGVSLLASVKDGKVNMVVVVSEDIVKMGVNAGNIAKLASKEMDGSGGGKPTMAMAGGKDTTKVQQALDAAKAEIKAILTK